MSKKNKLTKDELSKVQELTKEGQDFLTSIGRIEFQKSLFIKHLKDNGEKLEKFKIKFQEKYGNVNIDLSDGSYTKIEENVEDKKD
jgi:hypothetical protein|tara:strand:+ start:85 stop:342 length:258 start_codon:yes stop_codon:yes gene_type:complete